MRTPFNRFALTPQKCFCCNHYIWLEPYRRGEIWMKFIDKFVKVSVCRKCLPTFVTNPEDAAKDYRKLNILDPNKEN